MKENGEKVVERDLEVVYKGQKCKRVLPETRYYLQPKRAVGRGVEKKSSPHPLW